MYSITFDDGKSRSTLILDGPLIDLVPGQKLVVREAFITPAYNYSVGDVLELVQRTQEAPHHRTCSLGNWRVKDKFHTSIWSNIEWALGDGLLAPMVEEVV